MEGNTAKGIMTMLEEQAEKKGDLDWHTWLVAATKLCALLQGEESKLAEMEHMLMRMKGEYLKEGKTAAAAKALIEAEDVYLEVMKQRAFVKRCQETIMLAKKFATISSETYKAI